MTVMATYMPFTYHLLVWNGLDWLQVEGVEWLWRLWDKGCGGILGDDMGLGKTRQCGAFLRALLDCSACSTVDGAPARRALVVVPKSLVRNWADELGAVGLLPAGNGGRVHTFLSGDCGWMEYP